ncbi:hypothetical protein [Saccharothrix hoggarensis]
MTQEERLAAAEGLTEVLARTTGAADHPTGLARATATATGELTSLDLHPNALAQGADAIGRLVVETARLATDAAVQKSYNELAKSLGDSMAMTVEAFAGPPPLRAARSTGAAHPGWSAPQPFAGQRPPEPARPGPHLNAQPGRPAAPPRPADPGRPGTPRHPVEPNRPGPAHQQGSFGWSGAQPRPAHPSPAEPGTTATGPTGQPAPPWAGQQGNRPAPRPEPEETDDDDYFADPFRGQRQ